MDVREKLVELIFDSLCRHVDKSCKLAENIADDLISSGVTVQEDCKDCAEATQNCIVKLQEQIAELRSAQEWVSVKERLPQEKVNCIVHYKHAYCDNDDYWAIGMCFYDGEKFQFDPAYKVTHWMPLPEPPKETHNE